MKQYKWLKSFALIAIAAKCSIPYALAIPTNELRPQDNQIFIGLQGNQYLSSSSSLADKKSGTFGAKISLRQVNKKDTIFRAAIEAEGYQGLNNTKYRYIDIGEGFVGAAQPNWGIYLGRKRQNWNALDSYWSLGLYQPRFRWDYLNERQSGIMGLFLQATHEDKLEITAYYSPIFIPEQGAPFDITNGECKSTSPWFHCPNSTVMLFNQNTKINFHLDVPPISKLILHEAYGATARIGKENKIYGRISYVNKPINQLLLAYEGRLDLATLELPATIHVRVLRHELFGAEVGGSNKIGSFNVGAIHEKPQRDFTPSNWNRQEVENALFYGGTFRTNMFGLIDTKTRFEFSYLHRDGGNPNDTGPFATNNTTAFEPRFAFRNAFSLGIYSPIKDDWANRFLFSMRYILDTIYNGNILATDFHYKAFRRGFLNLGIDILGSETLSNADFISKNQRNDRIRGGFTYVF